MHGFTLMVLGAVLSADPVVLTGGTVEVDTRRFAMPLQISDRVKGKVERIRLFVSEDRGTSWKHVKDYKPTDELVIYKAKEDGLYWFALQTVHTDGSKEPAEVEDLEPDMRVYVNTEGRTVKGLKTYGELVQEVEGLRKQVEVLEQRVQKLEAERKPKQGQPKSSAPSERLPWVTGWDRPINPKGDCRFEPKEDRLTIIVPGKDHKFFIVPTRRSLNGPRLLRDVEGDFVVEVHVSGDSWEAGANRSRGAGIVVMDDKEPVGTLEFQGRPDTDEAKKSGWEIRSEICKSPDAVVSTSFDYGPVSPPLGSAYLRLERRGDEWRASFRKDHKGWKDLPTLTLDRKVPRKLKVGVFAEANVEGTFNVTFDRFKLSQPSQ